MNQPTELPIFPLLRMVAGVVVGLLLLLALCTPMKVHKHNFESLKRNLWELIGPHALFFKWNGGITVGLFLLWLLCPVLGNWFEWPQLTAFGSGCKFFAFLSCLGFLWVLSKKADAQQNRQAAQAFFAPRIMEIKIGDNYGNVAAGNVGPVHQSARVDSIVVQQNMQQEIHLLIDAVSRSGNELTAPQKSDVVEKLNTIADQLAKAPAQREPSKIQAALKLLPGLLSSVSALAQAWEKLEPWIKTHFGRG